MPQIGVDVVEHHDQEQQDHRHLDRHDDRVDRRRLGDAHVAQPADRADDDDGRQIDQCAGGDQRVAAFGKRERGRGQRRRQGEIQAGHRAEHAQQFAEVARPRHRHGGCREQVFQHQRPADEPGDHFAQGGVGIGVGAAGNRQHRGELRVAHAGQAAGHGGDQEAEDQRGAGELRRRRAGDGENARADDRTHPEHHQVSRRQDAFEGDLAFGATLHRLARVHMGHGLDGMGGKKIFDHQAPLGMNASASALQQCATRGAEMRIVGQHSRALGVVQAGFRPREGLLQRTFMNRMDDDAGTTKLSDRVAASLP